MTYKQKIEILKKRHHRLHNAVAINDRQCQSEAHKSRTVRKMSMAGPRKGFFRDLEIELGYALQFLQGECTEKEYLSMQLG